MAADLRILFCNCTYAKVLPEALKGAVLRRLCAAGREFEAVADLCELCARRDPALAELAAGGPVKIAACHPRAVKWLFGAAGVPLSEESAEVVNLREGDPAELAAQLLEAPLQPNLTTPPAPPAGSPDDETPAGESRPTAPASAPSTS